jgi:hypothetical protein
MPKKHCVLLVVAAAALAASSLACNMATQTPALPPDTVTPYVPVTTTPEQPTSLPAPTEAAPVEPTTPPETSPTETPEPTETPTKESPTATAKPTAPVSEGPLDFEEPRWVHAYAHKPDGGVVVTLTIKIIGGAPPFTVKHDGIVVGTTMNRQYYLVFDAAGCSAIVHNITVESADGRDKEHDYYLGKDVLPWCQ